MKSQSQIYSRYFTYIKPITRLPIIKTYGSTIFTLLVISIFIFFAIKPTITTILVLQKKLVDSTQVLASVTQKGKDLSLAQQNYKEFEQSGLKDKMDAAIPDSVQLKPIIQALEISAKNREASISALQIQPITIETKVENQVSSLAEISFTFNTEGSYQNLLLLLQDLKATSRLISIDSLSLSKISEGEGLIMSISGKAYYLK